MDVSGGDRTSGTGSERRETSGDEGERVEGDSDRQTHGGKFSRIDNIRAASEARLILYSPRAQ